MFLLILNAALAMFLGLSLANAKLHDASRGTNAVTRFIRDTSSNIAYTRVMIFAGIATIFTFLIGSLFKKGWACIPTALVIVGAVVLRVMSTRNKQRVKDARVVTKGSAKVVAATGGAAAAVVAAPVVASGGAAAAAATAAVAAANGASRVVGKCADKMKDVDSINVTEEDFKELHKLAGNKVSKTEKIESSDVIDAEYREVKSKLNMTEKDKSEFIETANRLGFTCNSSNIAEVATRVLSYAPEAALNRLPANLSDEQKAILIMKGDIKDA